MLNFQDATFSLAIYIPLGKMQKSYGKFKIFYSGASAGTQLHNAIRSQKHMD